MSDFITKDAIFPCEICHYDGFYVDLTGGYQACLCIRCQNKYWEYCDNGESFNKRIKYQYLTSIISPTKDEVKEMMNLRVELFQLGKSWIKSEKLNREII